MKVKDLDGKLRISMKSSIYQGTYGKLVRDIGEILFYTSADSSNFKLPQYNVEEEADKWFNKYVSKHPEIFFDEELECDMKSIFMIKFIEEFKIQIKERRMFMCGNFIGFMDKNVYFIYWRGLLYNPKDVKNAEKYVREKLKFTEDIEIRFALDQWDYDKIYGKNYCED